MGGSVLNTASMNSCCNNDAFFEYITALYMFDILSSNDGNINPSSGAEIICGEVQVWNSFSFAK